MKTCTHEAWVQVFTGMGMDDLKYIHRLPVDELAHALTLYMSFLHFQPSILKPSFPIVSLVSYSCILLVFCSASCRVTHLGHASSVTISLRFYLTFCCITLPVVIFALLKGCCYSASILLRVTHCHDLRVTHAVTVLS